jgi:2-C-methyl-D-erythritol 4-phosphate cytidylyltransferase
VRAAAIVPAAGRGERLGPGEPKALRELAGQPLLAHAVRALSEARSVDVIVVAAPEGEEARVAALLHPVVGDTELHVVTGGETRQRSVALALRVIPDDVDVVLVHDAARPLVPEDVIDAVTSAVRAGADAVVPAVPVTDTVKQVDTAGRVEATVDRSQLRTAQTPQGFARIVLESAHRDAAEQGLEDATDDAGLVEHFGRPVIVIPGSEDGFKVTRPLDLVLAEAVLARRRSAGVH